MLIPKRFLGIDIGTSYIKIAEISKFGKRKKLESYGSLASSMLYDKPFRTLEKNTLLLSNKDISRAISGVIEEAKIKAKQAVFSIPDFSTFFTNFELPPMTKEELPQAIRYEAKQYVPMPLAEVVLDWQIIEGEVSKEKKTKLRILLAAVPKEVINQYKEIVKGTGLQLFAMEAEVFSLVRALISKEEKALTTAIIDIGSQSTTCNIVDRRGLKLSHSFDMSSNEMTKIISKGLSLSYAEAEKIKKEQGLLPDQKLGIREILLPLVDVIAREVERIFTSFSQKNKKEVEKIILAGGMALLPGLKDFFNEKFNKEVEVANPFLNVFYPPILEKTLKQMGPSYAIAVGAALRGVEY